MPHNSVSRDSFTHAIKRQLIVDGLQWFATVDLYCDAALGHMDSLDHALFSLMTNFVCL